MTRKLKTMDGNNAAATVSYAFTEVAAIYPITPSSTMAEVTDQMAAAGTKNIFGQTVRVAEMQSEAGAAGAVHGSLAAGALTTTYTASQGLLLMIPNLYKVAGERMPGVFHVSARALAMNSLSIFGDHSDVMACRQTGVAMLCTNSPQEVMDLGAVAHLAAIKGHLPFLHFFDGFRTSHEIQKVACWDYKELAEMVDWDELNAFRRAAANPEHPTMRGQCQNDDVYFQAREACNTAYTDIVGITEDYMHEVNRRLGTNYELFNYVGAPDAEKVIVAMGSLCETIEETVNYLVAQGQKVGLVKCHLYRPFSAEHLINAIPETVKSISVLDRTKEPGSFGEPLFLDVVAALKGSKFDAVPVYAGRAGISSKDTTPSHIIPIYENMDAAAPKKEFTVGIVDDVTNLSLPVSDVKIPNDSLVACKFWGLGSDGTVGANKNSIKIIGDNTDKYVQGYFAYDSKKSGGVTVSHLRFGDTPITSTYLIDAADFVACHNEAYVDKYSMVQDLKDGGTFLLNCQWDAAELEEKLPASMKNYIAQHNIKFYTLNASKIAREVGLGNRVSTVLQAGFFKLANIIPADDALNYMKAAATKSFSKKGEDIVRMNHEAIEKGFSAVNEIEVPAAWATATDTPKTVELNIADPKLKEYIEKVQLPINAQQGNNVPVSAFKNFADGVIPMGSAAYEKRGVALFVPEWQPDKCIQCNQCAYVCPHAVIRPVALSEAEAANAPEGMKLVDMKGLPGYKFGMTVSALDCTGCGSCVNICPAGAKDKANNALVMKPLDSQANEDVVFAYAKDIDPDEAVTAKFSPATVKGSQFLKPYLEFSGACAGCGETPYAKIVTQMFGNKMMIANATGCSSIWGHSAPATPYCADAEGKGPAWGNSLFEDNAEYGYGMALANIQIRERLLDKVATVEAAASDDVKAACKAWMETYNDATDNAAPATELAAILAGASFDDADVAAAAAEVLNDKDYLAKKSQWIFGGDGWAYDIGFGGVDHVLAQNRDVNILVFDTEVYSNTGGQASKATPTAAIAQFAASGKVVKKKDLASIAMSYGYVYVAQVAMGADYAQTLKAIREAEAYKGPSLIIAYAPCINHGIRGGMSIAMTEEKKAVQAGYWHLFRYNPALIEEGKNPFSLDSKAPTAEYKDFIMGEVRYSSLKRSFPDKADALYDKSAEYAAERYDLLNRYITLYAPKDED